MKKRKTVMASTWTIVITLVLAACAGGVQSPSQTDNWSDPAAPQADGVSAEKEADRQDQGAAQMPPDYEAPPVLTEQDLDTNYRRITHFLNLEKTHEDYHEIAAFYHEEVALREEHYQIAGYKLMLRVEEYDLNADGRMDYIIGFEDTGAHGYPHGVLLREADGSFREIALPGPRGGYAVMPSRTNGLFDLVNSGDEYQNLIRYNGEDDYVLEVEVFSPQGFFGYSGGCFVDDGYLCRIVTTNPSYSYGPVPAGKVYLAGVAWDNPVLDLLEDNIFWCYDGTELFTLDDRGIRGTMRCKIAEGRAREVQAWIDEGGQYGLGFEEIIYIYR